MNYRTLSMAFCGVCGDKLDDAEAVTVEDDLLIDEGEFINPDKNIHLKIDGSEIRVYHHTDEEDDDGN